MANHTLFFWQNWRNHYRAFFIVFLVIALASLLLYFIQLVVGTHAMLSWLQGTTLHEVVLPADSFTKGLFTFNVELESYYVTEQFLASLMEIHPWISYLYMGFVSVSILLLLSVISVLPRFWYVGAMAVFILMLASFKFDLLEIFGWRNSNFFILAVAAYAGLSYYFHAFRPQTNLLVQFLFFTLLTCVFALLVAFFSNTTYPALSLVGHGIIIPIILSVVFILMISHEIVQALLYLVTKGGTNSLLHFTIITFFYLLNLLLAYLHNSGDISWDIFYINAFYLFPLSLILGLWGFRKRSNLFGNILSFEPGGAFLYLALAIISTITITYFFATANDPMIEMFEDAIIFSHIAMGLVFYMYVIINFRAVMGQGLPAHKVVYQPKMFAFYLARVLSFLIIIALLFRANVYPFYQSMAGYFNNLGDYYTLKQDYFLSEQYYKLGVQYDFQNHKSNYALASLARTQGDKVSAISYLKQSLLKNPSPYAYGSLGNIYGEEELFFEALFNLRQGVQRFPDNGELYNNLALVFNRTNIPDSAYYYYTLAQEHTSVPASVEANLLALWIKNRDVFTLNIDSLLKASEQHSTHISLLNNRLVLSQLNNRPDDAPLLATFADDSVLTRERFAYVFNYILNHKSRPDTSLQQLLTKLESIERNAVFSEDLRLALAYSDYYANDRARGLDRLNLLVASRPSRNIYFNKILGLWLLEQNIFNQAASHLGTAVASGDSTLQTNYALALSEAGQWPESLVVWSALADHPDQEVRQTAARMQTVGRAILTGRPAGVAESMDEAGKALLAYFSKDVLLPGIARSITNSQYRVRVLAELAERYIQRDSLVQAEQLLREASLSTELDAPLQRRINEVRLQLAHLQPEPSGWITTIDTLAVSEGSTDKKLFWKARSYEKAKSYKQAEQFYNQALKRLPTDADVVTYAGNFYNTVQKNPERAYQIALTALQLHPSSAALLKNYILQSLEVRLLTYAEESLDRLQTLVPAADYQAFLPVYESKKASVENMRLDWK